MSKEELRMLIQRTEDADVLAALWELYELKFCASSIAVRQLTEHHLFNDTIVGNIHTPVSYQQRCR